MYNKRDNFIKKSIDIHGHKYDYSKVDYKTNRIKVCIICPIHGEFWQSPSNHLKGQNCPLCKHRSFKYTNEEFIIEAKKIHGNKYDYSKIDYKNNHTKICIICKKHGEFYQSPSKHLIGQGCPICRYEKSSIKNSLNTEEFIKKAKEIHGDKYNYSKVEYVNSYTKVCIICPIHGEFWQSPSNHIHSRFPQGCPLCKSSKLESFIFKLLKDNNIDFEYQKRFDWLGKQSLDFYLPKYNIAIECQGIQHFKPIKLFGGEYGFNKNKLRDNKKFYLCRKNNVKILYYSNIQSENIISDENILLKEIYGKKL